MKLETELTEMHRQPRRGLLKLGMYAQHLGTGSTFVPYHSIGHNQEIHQCGTDNAVDTKISTTLSAFVYDEQKRWEDVPSRRETYTFEMLDDMGREFADSGRGSNTLDAALVDWFACGLFAGLHLGEYAQDAHKSEITS
jgi:hypothetical protein